MIENAKIVVEKDWFQKMSNYVSNVSAVDFIRPVQRILVVFVKEKDLLIQHGTNVKPVMELVPKWQQQHVSPDVPPPPPEEPKNDVPPETQENLQ